MVLWFDREPELVLLDMQSVPAGQEGWLAFDVTSASNRWLLHPRSNLGIRLYVETEEGELLLMYSLEAKYIVPVRYDSLTTHWMVLHRLLKSLVN